MILMHLGQALGKSLTTETSVVTKFCGYDLEVCLRLTSTTRGDTH